MQSYRRDIEGLRAIAVFLVILYHYQFPVFSGGFIGVDVFFVISGFVITQLLSRAMLAGKFRFREFYSRRIRRLVPVFLLVSSATFFIISPFYMDDDYYIFSKSWMASLIGLSNFYFYTEFSRYFSPDAQLISLLHTWSLAVEEQFYLLWPALFFCCYKWITTQKYLIIFMVIWLMALTASIYLAETNPKAAYYLLPARLYELMLGAGLAIFYRLLPPLNTLYAELLSGTGIILIVGTSVLLTQQSHFPGYNALWPTLGTALIIYAGMYRQDTLASRLLSTPVLVFFGGISYSLYLWHWPPIALANYQLIELTLLHKVLLIIIIVFLSYLSFCFVENRFRYLPWSFSKSFCWFILLPLVVIWLVQVTIRLSDDISFRIPQKDRELYKIMQQNNAADLYKKCFKNDAYHFDKSKACIFGDNNKNEQPNSVLIGDSHAISLIGFLQRLIAGSDYSLLLITRASTPFLTKEDARHAFTNETRIVRSQALEEYLSQRPMTVFVGAYWNSYLRNPDYQQYFINSIDWLLQHKHRVILLEDVPELPSSSHAFCLLKAKSDCSVRYTEVQKNMRQFELFKHKIQQLYPAVEWINPRKAMCDELRCLTVLNGIPLYRDESHLNHIGSRELGRVYLEQFDNPLLPKQ